nr:MAG TPA: hypothetical protein [Caudoviricetes sp.]
MCCSLFINKINSFRFVLKEVPFYDMIFHRKETSWRNVRFTC